MMAMGLTASAKDGMPATDGPAKLEAVAAAGTKPAVKAKSKTGAKSGSKSRRWFEVGIASWYGSQFQGRQTAGGERFDMDTMTCAHPSLPMGTWLRVTNLKNRRTALVRVNDRGPVIDGRIVDLSRAAARMLGLAGIGTVKLEQVRAEDAAMATELVAQLKMPVLFGFGLGSGLTPLGRMSAGL